MIQYTKLQFTKKPPPDDPARRAEVGTRNVLAHIEDLLNAQFGGRALTPQTVNDMQAIVDNAERELRHLGETLVNPDGYEIIGFRFFVNPEKGRVVLLPLLGGRVSF